MNKIEASHPLSSDIALVSEALKEGVAEQLPYWGMMRGIDVTVFNEDLMEDHSTYVRMELAGGKALVEYKLAPANEAINPMVVIEAEEDGAIVAKPVLARMVVSSNVVLMPLFNHNGRSIKSSLIQVDVLPEGAVISGHDNLGVDPVFGEYEGNVYDFIRNKSYDELRLGYMLNWARDFLNAA